MKINGISSDDDENNWFEQYASPRELRSCKSAFSCLNLATLSLFFLIMNILKKHSVASVAILQCSSLGMLLEITFPYFINLLLWVLQPSKKNCLFSSSEKFQNCSYVTSSGSPLSGWVTADILITGMVDSPVLTGWFGNLKVKYSGNRKIVFLMDRRVFHQPQKYSKVELFPCCFLMVLLKILFLTKTIMQKYSKGELFPSKKKLESRVFFNSNVTET